jgi:hypothetical protein
MDDGAWHPLSTNHTSAPHSNQNPAAIPRQPPPRPSHGVDQPRRAAVAARLPGLSPPPQRPLLGRARASSSATRRKVPPPSPRAPPPDESQCCPCRWIAVQAGGDLQRTGGGADQHHAGDPRPADEHTGGGRHGDAGAAGGSQGAGRGLRRQVPRQAAPSARRFPQRLGRHRRQCRASYFAL